MRSVSPIVRAAAVAAALAATGLVAAPAQAKQPRSSTILTQGDVTATLKYKKTGKRVKKYSALRLSVSGPQGGLVGAPLPKVRTAFQRPVVTMAELNGDGIPDVVVDTYDGGAHCCSTWSVALSTPDGWRGPQSIAFGNYPPQLQELGGAPGAELVGRDDRFAYTFSSYAASFPAIQIYAVRSNRLVNATREYPDAIRAAVAESAKTYGEVAASLAGTTDQNDAAQSAAAAWIANLLLLGDTEGAKAVLAKLTADGFREGSFDGPEGFTSRLTDKLIEWGYLTSPSQLGL